MRNAVAYRQLSDLPDASRRKVGWTPCAAREQPAPLASAANPNIVRTLWHGSALSVYEELSLSSFVKCGHEVEVYAYEAIEVPQGVKLCDANEIIPRSEIFSYGSGVARGSFAAFSNLFRLKLLYERGGIWADSDVLCLKPMHDLPPSFVGRVSDKWLNGALLRFPQGDPVCKRLFERADALGKDIFLGQTAELITAEISDPHAGCNILPASTFYPIAAIETWKLVDPAQFGECERLSMRSHCVHWWNAVLTLSIGLDKDALPPKGSFIYEKALDVFEAASAKAWPIESVLPLISKHKAYTQAQAATRAKDWSQAIGLWEKVLSGFGADKASADEFVNLARAYRLTGDFESAEKTVEQGRLRYPEFVTLEAERAEVAMARKHWSKAIKHWRTVLDRADGLPRPRYFVRLSLALRNAAKFDAADSVIRQSLSYYPKDMDLASEFAEIAMARKDWQEAIVRWRAVLNDHGARASAKCVKRMRLASLKQAELQGWEKLNSRVSRLLGKFGQN
jgi:tetratricopeptide (TPR) repeat protein